MCRAVCAQSFAESSPQLSRQLGNVSMTLSLAGVAVSLLMVTIIFYTGGFQVHSHNLTAVGNSTLDVRIPSLHVTSLLFQFVWLAIGLLGVRFNFLFHILL